MTETAAPGLDDLLAQAVRLVARSPADLTTVAWIEARQGAALESSRGRRAELRAGCEVHVRVRESGRTGGARADLAAGGDLERALRLALAAARLAEPSPDWDVGVARTEPPPATPGYDAEWATLAAAEALERLRGLGDARATLRLDWRVERVVVAASFHPPRSLRATRLALEARTGRRPGSGYAARGAADWPTLAAAELIARARELEPAHVVDAVPEGPLPVVLAPEAAIRLLEAYVRIAGSARFALAGRCAPALAPVLELEDDPLAGHGLALPFDLDGCAKAPRPLAAGGRPLLAAFDLELAARAGRAPTGHGLAADDAWPLHPALAPGITPENELWRRAAGGLRIGALEELVVEDDAALGFRAVVRNLRRIGPDGALAEGWAPLVWQSSLAAVLGNVAEAGRERVVGTPRLALPGAVTAPALRLESAAGFAPRPAL